MPIRPQDIDATIQNALTERLTQIFSPQAALDPMAARVRSAGQQAWRETVRRYTGYFWGGLGGVAAGVMALPLVAPSHEGLAVLLFMLLNGLGAGLVFRGFAKAKQEITRYVSPGVMRCAAHLVALSRAEQLYCGAVAALIDAGPTLGETPQQEILRQINGLLENHRKLAAPIQHAASATHSVEALERELGELTRRRDSLEDPTARETMEQSLALCSRRLEYARALDPAREKAEAQQELILQTLASVEGSLTRISVTHSAPVELDVDELQQSVTQTNHRARAVEEAVNEVLALRA